MRLLAAIRCFTSLFLLHVADCKSEVLLPSVLVVYDLIIYTG